MRNTTGGNGSPRVPRRSGVVGLHAVPRLEELVADPDKLGVLDPRTRRALTTTALTALNTLIFNELTLAAEPSGSIALTGAIVFWTSSRQPRSLALLPTGCTATTKTFRFGCVSAGDRASRRTVSKTISGSAGTTDRSRLA